MTHDAAVRAVVNLVPDIEKRGANAVLLDYAMSEDLPPAQLEKLAHVFNTLRTVDHIGKSDDRGSSIGLVDVPSLVIGYATGLGQEKKARTSTYDQSHVASQVDLMSALRSAVAGGTRALKTPHKQAAAKLVPASSDDLVDAANDLAAEARINMSKLAGEILNGAGVRDGVYDLSAVERDALHETGHAAVKSACDWLDKTVHLHKRTSIRHDYSSPLTKRAFAVGGKLSEKLVELAEAVTTYSLMNKLAGIDDGQTDAAIMELPRPKTTSRSRVADAMAGMSPEEAAEFAERARAAGVDLGLEDETDEETGDASSSEEKSTGGNSDAASDATTTPSPRDAPTPASKEKSTEQSNERGSVLVSLADSDTRKIDPVHAAWGAINSASSALNKGVTSAYSAVDGMLQRITAKERSNKSQRSSDLGVSDVIRAMNIKRLIGTDAVLRHADPRQVLSVYNSIARMNPDIANDMTAVTLLLREAVSYEGITLDSQKTLADIRKSTGDSEAKEYDNDKRRYAVGGALPIGLVARK